MKKIIAAIILTLSLVSCGGGGDATKDLFSLWIEDGTGNPLNLTGGTFNTPLDFAIFFVRGEQCNCKLTFIGTQSSGFYNLNSCNYQFGTGSEDPGCNALDSTGTYSKSSNTLTITPSTGSASTYH